MILRRANKYTYIYIGYYYYYYHYYYTVYIIGSYIIERNIISAAAALERSCASVTQLAYYIIPLYTCILQKTVYNNNIIIYKSLF